MEIQINTDRHVAVDDQLRDRIQTEVDSMLEHFEHSVTRVEVHFRDESAGRTVGDHIRCLLEARPSGQEPLTVEAGAGTATEALVGAVDKLDARLQHTFDRLADMGLRATIRGR
ncbi:hypothetical protein NPS01_39520 [Nocardioides psychrotolerans]|uniref:Sigma 54 modulation protein / S30EA ribosomal protein n=1 Tax=Nocardioides psychrotolerans TaxID=1005945 RepID=A0A1I3QXA5_9ACTN|nr:HPF/RaiA family ribosome-associated protein [Nocardioides psychrotolerans]GEP40289.1 hypothetical protein NPS01_39520 [Nocardioides psychrotolerans]SFJ37797.1 Sigma 54 modulation protein / S30EA ribosomal protein [Nocardioides psychrotolerans]